jgi:hypothetical protein
VAATIHATNQPLLTVGHLAAKCLARISDGSGPKEHLAIDMASEGRTRECTSLVEREPRRYRGIDASLKMWPNERITLAFAQKGVR